MTKKLLLLVLSLGMLFPAITLSPAAYAASDAACSIWLCLPTGFPSGCGDAKSAFIKRIKKFKPPLPSFSSCLYKGGSTGFPTPTTDMDAKDGFAAMVAERRVCTQWKRRGSDDAEECVKYSVIPAHIQKGTRCRIEKDDGKVRWRNPKGCYRTIRYVDTYMDGKPYGETHYFDSNGGDISISGH